MATVQTNIKSKQVLKQPYTKKNTSNIHSQVGMRIFGEVFNKLQLHHSAGDCKPDDESASLRSGFNARNKNCFSDSSLTGTITGNIYEVNIDHRKAEGDSYEDNESFGSSTYNDVPSFGPHSEETTVENKTQLNAIVNNEIEVDNSEQKLTTEKFDLDDFISLYTSDIKIDSQYHLRCPIEEFLRSSVEDYTSREIIELRDMQFYPFGPQLNRTSNNKSRTLISDSDSNKIPEMSINTKFDIMSVGTLESDIPATVTTTVQDELPVLRYKKWRKFFGPKSHARKIIRNIVPLDDAKHFHQWVPDEDLRLHLIRLRAKEYALLKYGLDNGKWRMY
ncbi:unnamed protein product [Ambrosiozyma monospora]|uniref:Unnamed protein product n=1 Tax=Ambrosiozyma monospora TaxID=43982 RepID=A0A9W6YSX8_AMBMO|nr:unnamed protein product [Ambrosiozyma monospora]